MYQGNDFSVGTLKYISVLNRTIRSKRAYRWLQNQKQDIANEFARVWLFTFPPIASDDAVYLCKFHCDLTNSLKFNMQAIL